MTVIVNKPAVNIREELALAKDKSLPNSLRVSETGNIAVRTSPSNWFPSIRTIDLGTRLGIYDTGITGALAYNAFGNTTTNFFYKESAAASLYTISAGSHRWYTAPSGIAGQSKTVISGNSYTITEAGGTNYTSFGAADNNVGTSFTATSSGTGNGGNVTQNVSFTTAMTLTNSGNQLLGTTSETAGYRLKIVDTLPKIRLEESGASAKRLELSVDSSGDATISAPQSSQSIILSTVGTPRAKITSGGDFVVGQLTASRRFEVWGTPLGAGGDATGALAVIGNNNTAFNASPTAALTLWTRYNSANGAFPMAVVQAGKENATDGDFSGYLSLQTTTAAGSSTERARITSTGYLKASTNGIYGDATGPYHEFRKVQDNLDWTVVIQSATPTAANHYGLKIDFRDDPNGTINEFLYCEAGVSPVLRASIRSNGGIANYSGNNVNLSDRREKINFSPAKSYLDAICAIPVQTFNYIDQSEDDPGLTLGVVAQDVQAVAPELVMESNWGTKDESKMRLSIYQTDLQYALMKCIQEQQVLINDLRARVAVLENK